MPKSIDGLIVGLLAHTAAPDTAIIMVDYKCECFYNTGYVNESELYKRYSFL